MIKRIFLSLAAAIAIGVAGFVAYAWHSEISPIQSQAAAAFSTKEIERGRQFAGAGNCASCHTAPGGADYAGGLAMPTGFGTVYSTNITPDPETGIGRWSEAAFGRAMREGVSRDGSHLFPAFPYTHFTKVSDGDLRALYAYFQTRTPVRATARESELPFPLDIRLLQAGWKLLFFDEGAYAPVADKDAAWNRGAYLAEGLGHCSACHTPRNALGAEKTDAAYAGALTNGWYAPALDAGNAAPLAWTEQELFGFLRTGATALHGVAAGSMSEVVHDGLARLPDSDIRALAVYFADMAGTPAEPGPDEIVRAMTGASAQATGKEETGARLFAVTCAACHYNRPGEPNALRPELSLNSAVTGPDPTNLIRFLLKGVDKTGGHPDAFMSGYDRALSDRQIADIAGYLHGLHAKPKKADEQSAEAWQELESRVRKIRQTTEDMR